MRPTLRQLEYIVNVHRLGRFGLAADKLNVSQPSLSAQIQAVEQDLGVKLFERHATGATATAKGAEFVTRAEQILRSVDDLRRAMQSNVPFAGRLRLGVLPSIAPYLLPDAIRELHQDQPDLRVVLREENTLQLKEGLRSGRFDLIVSTPEDHPNARQIRLFREKLWVAVALDDPLAKVQGAVGPRDLEGQRFLTLDLGHRIARITYALAATCKGVVSDEYEGTSMDALVLMAASGAGVAIVPDLFARRQAALRQEVVLRPLELEGASRDIALLYRGERSDEREVHLVAKTLLRNAQKQGLEHLYTDI